MQLTLIHSGRYTARQRHSQFVETVFIAMSVSGLEYGRVCSPTGRLLFEDCGDSLFLVPAGCRLDFSFTGERENFVIGCRIPELLWQPENLFFELPHRNGRLRLPLRLPPDRKKCWALRDHFLRIIDLEKSALPTRRFAAEQLARALLAEFAAGTAPATGSAPGLAEQLKQAIDLDIAFRATWTQLCRNLGHSPGYSRRIFELAFGITPGAYRAGKRLNRITDLLSRTELSPKEIAEAVGMNHVTHLNAFVKKHCGIPPGQLRRQLPGGSLPPPFASSRLSAFPAPNEPEPPEAPELL